MKIITADTLNKISQKAKDSKRLRTNLNLHTELSDPLQRLLNAMEPNTYVQPHKHEDPDKREVFMILRGKAVVILFTDSGEISEHFILDPLIENYIIEIPEKVWHSIIALKEGTVLFEVKDGPYQANSDKNFANWAPKEGNENCRAYNREILEILNL